MSRGISIFLCVSVVTVALLAYGLVALREQTKRIGFEHGYVQEQRMGEPGLYWTVPGSRGER